jgi:diaminopimelate dehydrogenase
MIRVGIVGYGNLGKGVELAIQNAPDIQLLALFTRRKPSQVETIYNTPVFHLDDIEDWKEKIDVLILCGGSASDLPEMTPNLAQNFNVVDSFDNHSQIPEHFNRVDAMAQKGNRIALISGGWDPGLFSLNRLFGEAILPQGKSYTFWGKGVSQGHSDAIRRVPGVRLAKQYTIPNEEALETVRQGQNPTLSTSDKHLRDCYVVLEQNADPHEVEIAIKSMPNYFADYKTTVHFIDEAEFNNKHTSMAHGGYVFRTAHTGFSQEHQQVIEYHIKLDSNPEFTGSVLVAYARAIYKMHRQGSIGCKTVLDVPPGLLSEKSPETLRASLL